MYTYKKFYLLKKYRNTVLNHASISYEKRNQHECIYFDCSSHDKSYFSRPVHSSLTSGIITWRFCHL